MALVLDTAETVQRTATAVLSCKQIAERALRKINAFSINDTAADPAELEESLYWLDMVVSHLAETHKCLWLIGGAVSVSLDADTASYDLADAMGEALPAGGVLFPIAAYLTDANGNDSPLELISRSEYNAAPDKDTTGTPSKVYIDRTNAQTIYIFPVPTVSTYTLKLDIQAYLPDMNRSNGVASHGFSQGWQLWMVTKLASYIGDGPVRRLATNVVSGMKQEAKMMLDELLAFSNQQKPGQEGIRRTRGWGV